MTFHAEEWTYNYESLASFTGLPVGAVYTHKSRKRFDPNDLESVLLYMAEYARPDLQQELVNRALRGTRSRVVTQAVSADEGRKKGRA